MLKLYAKPIGETSGLARLLLLERFPTFKDRQDYLKSQHKQLSVGEDPPKWTIKYRNDLKRVEDLDMEDIEISDYDEASLHIPYGPGISASKISWLVESAVRLFAN